MDREKRKTETQRERVMREETKKPDEETGDRSRERERKTGSQKTQHRH